MENVLFNYVVNGVVIEGPMSYQSVLERTGLKDTVGLTELGYVEILATHDVPEITQEQIQAGIRGLRSYLLEKSDWTQMPDAALSTEKKSEWVTYRQALRDMPETFASATSIQEVTTPTEPAR
jgi:hypothetical protein